MRQSFPIAPMSPSITGLTAVTLAVPVALAGAAWILPGAGGLLWIAGSLVALYASVWIFWRPLAFELSEHELTLRFPLRRKGIARSDVTHAELLSGLESRRRLGPAVRIGAGGLWGAFGWLWSRRMGMVELYVSRTDELVLIERRHGRALLVSPTNPDAFLAELGMPNATAR